MEFDVKDRRYKSGALRVRSPKTVDDADRTCEVVAVTSDPVTMMDWVVPYTEILRMDKVRLPGNGQVPLCDSHGRWSVKNVIGSFRDIGVEDGKRLVGKVHFSVTPDADEAFTKLKEGHLTDFSVGYMVLDHVEVEKNTTQLIGGDEYVGPCVVVKEWELFELSICPIGADPGAKARGNMEITRDVTEERAKTVIVDGERPGEPGAKATAVAAEARAKEAESEEEKKKGKKAEPEGDGDEAGEEDEEEEEKKEAEAGDEGDDKDDEKKKGKKSRANGQAERDRVRALMALGKRYDLPYDEVGDWVANGLTVNEASARTLEIISKKGKRFNMGIEVTYDEGEGFRSRVTDAISLKCRAPVDKPAPGAADLADYSCVELAKECLRHWGKPTNGRRDKIIERALSTTDLPIFLMEGTERLLRNSLTEAPETWQQWTGEISVPDFRSVKLVSVEIDNDFKDVSEGGEYEYASMKEAAEELSVKTFGRMFQVTREALINDDLGGVAREIQALGRGVVRHIAESVYDTFRANPIMGDGQPLFSAAHVNVVTVSDAIPSVDSVSKALMAMAKQKDLHNRRLNIRPEFLLAPLSMMPASETFFTSEFIGTAAQPTTRNIYQGQFKRVYDPRLDDQGGDAFYLVGPKDDGVLVAYLNGEKSPYLEWEQGFAVDALRYKVRFDYGVKAVSWRNFVRVEKA